MYKISAFRYALLSELTLKFKPTPLYIIVEFLCVHPWDKALKMSDFLHFTVFVAFWTNRIFVQKIIFRLLIVLYIQYNGI